MKLIEKKIAHVTEELEGAQNYAERYIECKAKGHTQRANAYKSMAQDELQHAQTIFEFAVADIAELRKAYTASVEVNERWGNFQKKFVEWVAMIKYMIG